MLARVGDEVEVELGDRRLHDAPHRLAEVGHEAHELERLAVCRPGLAEVGAEQRLALRRVELVVDGEVREVEEPVSHPRVLPVDDPQALAVVEEVRVQEVVVARHRFLGRALGLDPSGDLVRPLVASRERSHPGRARSRDRPRRRGTSRTFPESPARRGTRAAPRRRARACPARASARPMGSRPR